MRNFWNNLKQQEFWNNMKRQAEENPILAIAVVTALLSATTRFVYMGVQIRNSHVWAKEVQRRAMKDVIRRSH